MGGAACDAKRYANDTDGSGRASGSGNAAADDPGGASANHDWSTHSDHDESCG